MHTRIYFTNRLPSDISNALMRAGFRVFEALAISEVLHLCETETIGIVVVAVDVDDCRASVIAQHHSTLRLKLETTSQEVIAELWRLFPDKSAAIH